MFCTLPNLIGLMSFAATVATLGTVLVDRYRARFHRPEEM